MKIINGRPTRSKQKTKTKTKTKKISKQAMKNVVTSSSSAFASAVKSSSMSYSSRFFLFIISICFINSYLLPSPLSKFSSASIFFSAAAASSSEISFLSSQISSAATIKTETTTTTTTNPSSAKQAYSFQGNSIFVDGVSGLDSPNCGSYPANPCQSISQAISLSNSSFSTILIK